EPASAGIHGDQHGPGFAFELGLELPLHSTEATIIQTNIAQHLGSQLPLWIETLGLFLKVNSFKIQVSNTAADLPVNFSRHPRKRSRGTHAVFDITGSSVEDSADDSRRRMCVRNLGRHGKHRIHSDRHRQIAAITVKDVSPDGGNLNAALLLTCGSL